MAADLVGGDPVLTVVLKDSHGSVTGEQSFTARQLSGLSQTGAVGYQYWKKGAEDPDYQPEQPTQPENPGVKTGDESYVVLWSAALLLGGAALVLLPRKSGADTGRNKRR